MSLSPQLPAPIQDYVDAFNRGDFPKLLGLFTPDALIHGVLGSAPISQAEPVWRELHNGMAMRLHPEAVAVDGSTVVVRYMEHGCFQGPFRGLAGRTPTNLPYAVPAMEWFELDGERIANRWGSRDFAAITRQVLDGQ